MHLRLPLHVELFRNFEFALGIGKLTAKLVECISVVERIKETSIKCFEMSSYPWFARLVALDNDCGTK